MIIVISVTIIIIILWYNNIIIKLKIMKLNHLSLISFVGFFLFINSAAAGSINIISPVEGTVFGPSSTVDIKWTQSSDVGKVMLGMYTNSNTGENIANSDTPFKKDGDVYSYSFYNDRSYTEKTDKIFRINSYTGGFSSQVKVTFTPGESSNTPSSIKTSSIKIISPNTEAKEYVDSVPISWEQHGISGPATLHIINNFGTIIDSYGSTSANDGIQTYNWKITNSAKNSPDSNKYKVSITAPTNLTGVTPVYVADESSNFFSVKLNEEKITPVNFYPVNVKLEKSSFKVKDLGSVTWSSECKAPFVDVVLVKEGASGWEDFIYLTPWTEGYAQYSNSSFTKNKGSLSFYIPDAFAFKSINKIYSFSFRLVDGSFKTTIGNGNILPLESGKYRIRVIISKHGPSQMIWPGNKVEDMSSYPDCAGTGLSETFNIGNESNVVATPVTNNKNTSSNSTNTQSKTDTKLVKSLSGKILIQSESKGEFWYVNPKDGKRYALTSSNAALKTLKTLGTSMSAANIKKIKSDATFRKKYIGQVLFQTGSKGDIYYISFDGRYNYLKDGASTLAAMKKLGVNVSNANLNNIVKK